MTSPYRSTISYRRLVNDCWGILKEEKEAIFPRGSRAAPSPVVYVVPPPAAPGFGYYWEFWEKVVAPTLGGLAVSPPPYVGGWANLSAKEVVEAALRSEIETSSWKNRVNFED